MVGDHLRVGRCRPSHKRLEPALRQPHLQPAWETALWTHCGGLLIEGEAEQVDQAWRALCLPPDKRHAANELAPQASKGNKPLSKHS